MYFCKMMVVKSHIDAWVHETLSDSVGGDIVWIWQGIWQGGYFALCMGHRYLNLSNLLYAWETGWDLKLISALHMNTQIISPFVSKIANHRNNFIISHEHFNSPWSKRQVRYKLWLASLAIKLTNSYAQATHVTLNSHMWLSERKPA